MIIICCVCVWCILSLCCRVKILVYCLFYFLLCTVRQISLQTCTGTIHILILSLKSLKTDLGKEGGGRDRMGWLPEHDPNTIANPLTFSCLDMERA